MNVYFIGVDFRFLRDPVQSPFSFFFLYFKGDSFDGSSLDTLDQVSGIACDFIPETLGGDLGDFGKDFFIDVEVVGELDVMFFKEHLSSSFDCFCSDSAH